MTILRGLGRSSGRFAARARGEAPALAALVAVVGCGGLLAAACSAGAPQTAAAHSQAGASTAPGGNSGSAAGSGSSAGSGSGGTNRTAPASTPSAAPSQQPGPQPTGAQQVEAPQPPAAPACRTLWLHGSIGAPNGAAGTFYYPVEFTNTSATTCALYGYPGVSVVTRPGGPEVGPAATRVPTFKPQLVTVAPGQTAHAALELPDPGDFPQGACQPATVHWLRVFPPGQVAPLYISVPILSDPMKICTGQDLNGAIAIGTFVVLSGATGS